MPEHQREKERPSERERRLDRIVTEFLEARDHGEAPSPDALLERYPELRNELRAFLDADREWQALAESLGDVDPRAEISASGRIGSYELLGEIGRGGMGVVYRARHETLGRTVALKTIQRGALATAEDLERFHREMRVLARVEHRHIVPVYEIGEHRGAPYFAMRHIGGGPLTEHMPRLARDPRAAAILTEKLARAVQAAHGRGILHRDLKPGNVLLDRDGEPQLTDFGLAIELDAGAALTRTRATVGTPAYMAPEQASGRRRDVGVTADVYGLGAILYELLTGRPPFEADSVFELMGLVIEGEPVPPRRLNPSVPRDLETVCLRCLEKDPRRRYSTALGLAHELRRFLAGLPVRARPLGPLGRGWRWGSRNRAAVAVVGVLVAALLVSGLATRRAIDERNSANRARRSEELHRQAAEKLDEYLLDPVLAEGDVTVREILRRAEDRIEAELADELELRAAMRSSIARAYTVLGEYGEAARHYRRAVAEYRALGDGSRGRVVDTLGHLAFSLSAAGRSAEALELLTTELALGPPDAERAMLLEGLANVHRERAAGRQAIAAVEEALVLRRHLHGPRSPEVTNDLLKLSEYLAMIQDYPASRATLEHALELLREVHGDEHADVAWCLHELGFTLDRMGEFDRAEAAYRNSIRILTKLLGRESLEVAINLSNLARLAEERGDFGRAEELLTEALQIKRTLFGEDHIQVSNTLEALGSFYHSTGRLGDAETCFRRMLAMRVRFRGEWHPSVQVAHLLLGDVLADRGRIDEAMDHHREALRICVELYGAEDPETARLTDRLRARYAAADEAFQAEMVSAASPAASGDPR